MGTRYSRNCNIIKTMADIKTTQEFIDKIKEICLDFNPSLSFECRDKRQNNGAFYEIRITKTGSIFLEKGIESFTDIERSLLERKKQVFNQEDKTVLEEIPNIYIYNNSEIMSNIAPQKEEQVNFIVQKPKTTLERVILPANVKEEVESALSLI